MAKTKRNTPAGVTKVTNEQRISGAATGPERRIIPLAAGTWAYLIDPVTSRNSHMKVDSEAFALELARQSALSPAYADRLRRELASFDYGDFPQALERLVSIDQTADQAADPAV